MRIATGPLAPEHARSYHPFSAMLSLPVRLGHAWRHPFARAMTEESSITEIG